MWDRTDIVWLLTIASFSLFSLSYFYEQIGISPENFLLLTILKVSLPVPYILMKF